MPLPHNFLHPQWESFILNLPLASGWQEGRGTRDPRTSLAPLALQESDRGWMTVSMNFVRVLCRGVVMKFLMIWLMMIYFVEFEEAEKDEDVDVEIDKNIALSFVPSPG